VVTLADTGKYVLVNERRAVTVFSVEICGWLKTEEFWDMALY